MLCSIFLEVKIENFNNREYKLLLKLIRFLFINVLKINFYEISFVNYKGKMF